MPTDPAPSPAISETDMLIFRRLCNPQKVDLSNEPPEDVKLSPLPKTSRPPPPAYSSPPPKSTFAKALETPAKRMPPPPPSFREGPRAAPPSPPAYPSPHRPPPSPPAAPAPEDPSAEMHRRHANLLHLEKMRQMGTKLTREFTMEDSSEVTQFEIDYQENNQSVTNAVGMMKGAIGLGFTGLEMANAKFGPFLNLTGLSASACQDMSRYNQPLERIYRRFFRKKAMSPVTELLMLIFGTIFMTHFGNKGGPMVKMLLSTFMGGAMGGGGGGGMSQPEFTQRGFDPRTMPATERPPPPPPAAPSMPAPESRKTMRRPGTARTPVPAAAPPPPPPPAVINPPPPPPPRLQSVAMVFPIAGTPLKGMRASQEPPIMALPTVIEEITDEEKSADLDRDTFERLMKEVSQEEDA